MAINRTLRAMTRAVLRGRDFSPVKDRTLRTTPQLGISGMKSARIRNDRQKKKIPQLRCGVPFFLPKVWGQHIFYPIKNRPGHDPWCLGTYSVNLVVSAKRVTLRGTSPKDCGTETQ